MCQIIIDSYSDLILVNLSNLSCLCYVSSIPRIKRNFIATRLPKTICCIYNYWFFVLYIVCCIRQFMLYLLVFCVVFACCIGNCAAVTVLLATYIVIVCRCCVCCMWLYSFNKEEWLCQLLEVKYQSINQSGMLRSWNIEGRRWASTCTGPPQGLQQGLGVDWPWVARPPTRSGSRLTLSNKRCS